MRIYKQHVTSQNRTCFKNFTVIQMSEETKDYATLFFNHIQIENEIKEVWKEITRVRNDPSLSPIIKFSILSKLFEVHNSLDLESIREQEDYMASFLEELHLQELGVKPMTEGRLKCHIVTQMKRRTPARTTRSLSFGFFDPGIAPERRNTFATTRFSGILQDRKIEIEKRLQYLNIKGSLTPDEEKEKTELTNELVEIMKE